MNSTHSTYHQSESAIDQERKWIKNAQADPHHFGPIYDKYYLQIFRYLLKRIGDENTAAELTSNTFIKAIQNIVKFEFRGTPIGGWIYQIARNELQLHFRNTSNQRTVYTETCQLQEVLEDMEEEIEDSKISVVLESLHTLKSDELELLEMRYFEKRSFNEVSDILQISVANAKVKMHRIIKKLKATLLVS
ncbi:MAG: RNA polymerase sigma-70 factor (ECF subfamily) [Parvicella sp.]